MTIFTLELTEQELQALAGLLDAGVRHTGLRAIKDAAGLLAKIERATTDTAEIKDVASSVPASAPKEPV